MRPNRDKSFVNGWHRDGAVSDVLHLDGRSFLQANTPEMLFAPPDPRIGDGFVDIFQVWSCDFNGHEDLDRIAEVVWP